jgi:hypothetical protein
MEPSWIEKKERGERECGWVRERERDEDEKAEERGEDERA